MKLNDALRIQRGEVVSFVGAGGKTSTLFRLGHELKVNGWRVLGTTTTRIAAWETTRAPLSMRWNASVGFEVLSNALERQGFVFIYDQLDRDKALGIAPDTLRDLLDRVSSDVMLIEADGSRRLPFKAPYPHEPVIPPETTRVILVVGINTLGKPLDRDHVYNADAIIGQFGYPEGAPVLWPWMASVLRHEQLGLQGIRPDIPVDVLINQVQAGSRGLRCARLMSSLLLQSTRIRSVVLAEAQGEEPVHEVRRPVAAIVLAAGKSSRMGELKVLLPWGRETVLESILRRLYAIRLNDVLVVTGREAQKVEKVAAKYGARTVHNPDYEQGEMLSSLQTAIRTLGDRYDACLVVLGDQPQIQGRVIAEVLNAYAAGKGEIVTPSYQMRRGHPVLIGRRYWQEMLNLPQGKSPRDLLKAHENEIAYVNVNSDSILADIDTPEEYRAALRKAGLG